MSCYHGTQQEEIEWHTKFFPLVNPQKVFNASGEFCFLAEETEGDAALLIDTTGQDAWYYAYDGVSGLQRALIHLKENGFTLAEAPV